jgi:hypothetical protein
MAIFSSLANAYVHTRMINSGTFDTSKKNTANYTNSEYNFNPTFFGFCRYGKELKGKVPIQAVSRI